jgi:uncharacterized protein (TIGR02145 family)
VASQDICPTGWHLPSDWEWNNLEKEVTTGYTQYSAATAAPNPWSDAWRTGTGYRGGHGPLMRNPMNIGSTQNPAGLSNAKEKGFSGMLVGYAYYGSWGNYGDGAHCMTSSSASDAYSWTRNMYYSNQGLSRSSVAKNYMRSVRCKKDE